MELNAIGWENMDWGDLAQDWDRRRDFVNAIKNLEIP
jgi:hypothetical protein